MKSRTYYLILGIALVCTILNAEAQQISVRPIPITDQLPSNSVQRIYQDKEGFVWFGTTNGLCRYDAYKVLVFRSNQGNPNLLTNNEITCLAEDSDNNLLIGTRKGVNIINKNTYKIRHFDDKEIEGQEIKCMTITADGSIWICTNKRVFRYKKDFTLLKKYDSSLPISSANSIYEDASGNLWITFWRNGLFKYSPAEDTFIRFPKIGVDNNPFKIFQDSKKQYWVCTWGDGLYLFNPEGKGEAVYTYKKIINNRKQFTEDCFFSITQDDKYGYIWVMSSSGVYAFEYTNDNKIKDVDISYLFKESNNIFSEIMKDRTGNLWIATFGEGVLTINFEKPVVKNYLMPSIKGQTGLTTNITVVCEDATGDIWINQNRWGLGIFDPSTNNVLFYKDIPALKNITELNVVSCISSFRSMSDEIWVGPENAPIIYRLKKNKGDITITDKILLTDVAEEVGNPRHLYEDRKNNIWIATTNGLLVKRYNKKIVEEVNLSIGSITGIIEDTRGTIWINSQDSGIYQISNNGKIEMVKIQIEDSSKGIKSICADINGKVWIGYEDGNIILYDIVSQACQDLPNSYNIVNEGIQNIVSDDFGHVWISTNKRITEYNPINGASRDYLDSDGVLVNSFHVNSFFRGRSGKIFFGGNKGISIFTPSEKLSEQAKQGKALITDVKISNQSTFGGNDNQRFNLLQQGLVLNPNDKNIEIDFSSLDYTYSSKIKYAYRMDDVDDDWVYTESNRQFAIYNQLSKGSRTFYIKATDENSQWSNNITKIKIYKEPYFYETWWAYVIYVIVIGAFAWGIYTRGKRRIKLRHDLKIAQIEKEKSEELTQTKLRYFTNISHDFLTPLTIMTCLIDDAEMTYKNKITQFDSIRSNITRLKRLLQQVLDFRKVESGNMKLKISEGDIVAFIKNICDTHFIPLMKKKNIDFSFNSDVNHIQAFFDADKLDKIIFNLLSNAYKYTPQDGSVKINLSKIGLNRHSYLAITIKDTGIGIAPEDIDSIFTRFYTNQMNESNDTNGIGLSLVKDLLDIHHGTIRVESEVNKGTQFTITIPINKGSYSESELGSSTQIYVSNDASKPTSEEEIVEKIVKQEEPLEKDKTNVLLVEDNDELLILIQNILSRNYHVLTARNGKEALEVIQGSSIDIIVSDVMMPEMTGLELCQKVKTNLETSHIPLILLTAKNSIDDRIECYDAGADGYISKPFDAKVLDARIKNFLSNKRNKQQEFKSNLEINISTLECPTLDEQFLNNAVAIIEKYLSETEFDVNAFADSLNMSKSSLYRKIKTMTGLSPNEFIRNIRLKHASQMLKDPSISISDVAYSVGFSLPKYFTLCFKNEFNMTPSEYQKSLNR